MFLLANSRQEQHCEPGVDTSTEQINNACKILRPWCHLLPLSQSQQGTNQRFPQKIPVLFLLAYKYFTNKQILFQGHRSARNDGSNVTIPFSEWRLKSDRSPVPSSSGVSWGNTLPVLSVADCTVGQVGWERQEPFASRDLILSRETTPLTTPPGYHTPLSMLSLQDAQLIQGSDSAGLGSKDLFCTL